MFEERKANKALQELKPALVELDRQLEQVGQISNPIDRIVRFFDTVSRFNDQQQGSKTSVDTVIDAFRRVNGGKHEETIKALETLRSHFNNSGRQEFGMNRTKPGEPVTGDKVYLGNVYGRWTFTANDWQQKLSRDDANTREDKQVIEGQAKGFVDSHLGPMHRIIKALGGPK
jgi:hypothetical protein